MRNKGRCVCECVLGGKVNVNAANALALRAIFLLVESLSAPPPRAAADFFFFFAPPFVLRGENLWRVSRRDPGRDMRSIKELAHSPPFSGSSVALPFPIALDSGPLAASNNATAFSLLALMGIFFSLLLLLDEMCFGESRKTTTTTTTASLLKPSFPRHTRLLEGAHSAFRTFAPQPRYESERAEDALRSVEFTPRAEMTDDMGDAHEDMTFRAPLTESGPASWKSSKTCEISSRGPLTNHRIFNYRNL